MSKLQIGTVTTGDARKLISKIDPNSIDAILTDPVYQNWQDYHWLAQVAASVLKPGRSVVAQSGWIYREENEFMMRHARLKSRPLLTEHFTGGWVRIYEHKVQRASTPYIWREKDEFDGYRQWPPTSFFGSKDKGHHKWGDGERGWAKLVVYFTRPGGVVLDPFAGSSPLGRVCKKLGREYIGFEHDPETAEMARGLIADAQPPLFTLTWEQEQLWIEEEEAP